eukprot:CAMPEP_0119120796 /NCGR_PEP_ID=MMETSP1310-20130426/1696_1 /TAXON_ID=464262 /ORGANISM="Genus nov. species nov., Strain RCC2339" /LENGTH=287 /DNA_ID=CAMNT_0007110301 /DNA_START=76 /DNA_END=939 /DNA_ORIENTATION=+
MTSTSVWAEYVNLPKINVTEDGGIAKQILVEGQDGTAPPVGAKVNVHYVGTLLDGSKFDSSRDRGDPFTFGLGRGQVIKGWDQGVATMLIGEKSLLTCTSEYAYGESGAGDKIPGGATLQFEVELLSWDKDPETTEEKLEATGKVREEANALFKEGKLEAALTLYAKALDYWERHYVDSDHTKAVNEAKLPCLLNKTLVEMKLGNHRKAYLTANMALDIDESSVKAWFRRGQCQLSLGEFDEATSDFKQVLVLDPENKAAKKQLALVKKERDAALKAEKETWGRVFK